MSGYVGCTSAVSVNHHFLLPTSILFIVLIVPPPIATLYTRGLLYMRTTLFPKQFLRKKQCGKRRKFKFVNHIIENKCHVCGVCWYITKQAGHVQTCDSLIHENKLIMYNFLNLQKYIVMFKLANPTENKKDVHDLTAVSE